MLRLSVLMGKGKTIVELCSVEIALSVCKNQMSINNLQRGGNQTQRKSTKFNSRPVRVGFDQNREHSRETKTKVYYGDFVTQVDILQIWQIVDLGFEASRVQFLSQFLKN